MSATGGPSSPFTGTTGSRGVVETLTRCSGELERLAAVEPTTAESEAVMSAIGALLPDERARDLLEEVMETDIPGQLRAAAAFELASNGCLHLDEVRVRRLLSEVGPAARIALARGMHEQGEHDRARGLLQPLMRAVHDDVRNTAQLWYRIGPEEYADMPTPELVRDATREPGWLHRSWAAEELVTRGEIDDAISALDGAVGHWTEFRDDQTHEVPVRIVSLLARMDDPRAVYLLERASKDPLDDVRAAADDALAHPERELDLTVEERAERARRHRFVPTTLE